MQLGTWIRKKKVVFIQDQLDQSNFKNIYI